jgi:hypothetical protein
MLTLCKFVHNEDKNSSNVLITKTFGKFGVIQREAIASLARKPRHNEWWYCEIVRETGAGTERGLWVLKPIKRVELIERDGYRDNNITHLFPGLYTTKRIGNAVLVYPKMRGPHWICPNAMRRHLLLRHRRDGAYAVNSVLVVHDETDDWPRDYGRRIDPGGDIRE